MPSGIGTVKSIRVYNKNRGITVAAGLEEKGHEVTLVEYYCDAPSIGDTLVLVRQIFEHWCISCKIPYASHVRVTKGGRKVERRIVDPSFIPQLFQLISPSIQDIYNLHLSRSWVPLSA